MAETRDLSAHTSAAVLDIGDEIGALVIYTRSELHGQEIEVSPVDDRAQRTHSAVLARQANGKTSYAALFLALPVGEYTIWTTDPTVPRFATIQSGMVAEVDWRASTMPWIALALAPHTHTPGTLPLGVPAELVPSRYREGQLVCTTPMGAASLRYDAAGRVAWDLMWTDFCDLALAGGPPHRGTLLLPPTPAEVAADPDAQAAVIAEITRGWQLVTGLAVVAGDVPGWLGLVCDDDAMAFWLAAAITMENVSVRQVEHYIYLPAGPDFRLAYEIKNVVTVVAKTHHYWREHRS